MIYQILNKRTFQDKNGKDYTRADLTSPSGEVFKDLNAFRGEFVGETFEGELEQNGKFWNLKPIVTYTANFPTGGAKGGMIAKAQETKAQNIEHAQDRKEVAIANAGSITNATNLVVAMINAGIIPNVAGESQVQDAVVKYAKWYRTMYDNPSNNEDIPF